MTSADLLRVAFWAWLSSPLWVPLALLAYQRGDR